MASQTEICNIALSLIGNRRIEQMADSNVRARECTTHYEQARREVLEAHPWKRANARIQQAADATAPAFGYSSRYALPPDALAIISIEKDLPWEIEGDFIETDADGPLNIKYTKDLTDTSKFSALMVEAFSHKLAARIAKKLIEQPSVVTEQLALFDHVIAKAKNRDGKGRSPTLIKPSTWHDARLRGIHFHRADISTAGTR